MANKRCKIHYRRLRRENGQFPKDSLSTVVRRALKSTVDRNIVGEVVKQRISEVPRADGYQRVLNNFFETDEYVFGDICLFSPGQMQAFLQFSSDADHQTLDDAR